MHLYKRSSTWWIQFQDARGKRRKIRGATDKRLAVVVSRWLESLVQHATVSSPIPDDLLDWARSLDANRRKRLVDWGLLDERRLAAAQTLAAQLDQWRKGLVNRGRSDKYAGMKHLRASALLTASGAMYWRDIDAERIMQVVQDWRHDGRVPGYTRSTTVSEQTLAHYLRAMKQFTRWMVAAGNAVRDPMAMIRIEARRPRAGAVQSNMAKRRALTDDEQARLVSGTDSLPQRYNMTGAHRALLYHLALRTGLRAGAIRRLTAADVDPDGWLIASGSGASNKRTSAKPISGNLLQDLLTHAAGLEPDAPLFNLPVSTNMARMLRDDCAALGIQIDGIDFHALRHTFGTTMARAGVHPRTLMSLMDHTNIQITMRLYAHSMPDDEAGAVSRLPVLGQPTNQPTRTTKTA